MSRAGAVRAWVRDEEDEPSVEEAGARWSLTVVAHDMRSPLALIQAALESALIDLTEERTERAQEHVLLALQEVHWLERLADWWLGSEAGRLVLADTDVADVAADVSARVLLPHHVTLVVEAPSPVWAVVDGLALEQVIGNLVVNAMRYASTEVVVEARHEQGEAVVSIADDGPGSLSFSPEPDASSPADGIGLRIVESLVTAMGGRVDLRSIADRTEARLTFPSSPPADSSVR